MNTKKHSQTKLAKTAITYQANTALTKMLEILNKDSITKIKKQDLLSWLIQTYEKNYFQKQTKKIRKETQKPLSYAKSLIKELEKTNKNPSLSHIKSLFRK